MNIKLWGVRGSIPTPSTPNFSTSRFGGNTTCISIHAPGILIILDGGSGLRSLGMWLNPAEAVHGTFFFTHLHWDHIQGFPFFRPAFIKGNTFDMYGPKFEDRKGASLLEEALRNQQQHYNFPIELSQMPARMNITDIEVGQSIELKGKSSTIRVTSGKLNHPGGCFGYRIEEHRPDGIKTFVMATDNEHLPEINPSLQTLAKDADILLYDGQYTLDEYEGFAGPPKRGWGHSTFVHGIREAKAANVKRLLLTHHDPLRDDWAVARLENEARREGVAAGIDVSAAHEGMSIDL
ncbi:MAG: MBL fold metallo-hydrolase [Planctomycetota bacterium]